MADRESFAIGDFGGIDVDHAVQLLVHNDQSGHCDANQNGANGQCDCKVPGVATNVKGISQHKDHRHSAEDLQHGGDPLSNQATVHRIAEYIVRNSNHKSGIECQPSPEQRKAQQEKQSYHPSHKFYSGCQIRSDEFFVQNTRNLPSHLARLCQHPRS